MCIVPTYVIMHVIVYFGVWKCHVCSSHLCNYACNSLLWCVQLNVMSHVCSSHPCNSMFNLVMQPCPYKCVYIYVVVLYAIPSHNTHILLAAIVCVIIGLRTHF